VDLESKVNEQRAYQGLLGQLAAQHRLKIKSQLAQRSRRQEVARQLVATCHFDSAVRSINLSKHMNLSWSERPNAYKIMSQLDDKARRRINELGKMKLDFS
jgi:hypothetical protein